MVSTFLVSTAVTGVLLLGVGVFLREYRRWRHDKPEAEGSGFDALGVAMKSERLWIVAYVVLILVAAAATYGYIAGAAVPEELADVSFLVLGAVLAAGITAFVASGTYTAVRSHGRPSAQAAGASAMAVGLVILVAVAVKLLAA